MVENKISSQIIGCAIQVHKELGPGLLESAYKRCLQHELINRDLKTTSEVSMPISYQSLHLDYGYRIDLLVENKVVIEVKSVEGLTDVHLAQVLTYLKFGGFKLGLLINFNVTLLKHGVKRLIL